ncbi:hypothetical protein ACQW02_12040 [Humitalea sp. 24SJ18S-53]|uniref:hypothetical protein n=1 Tax=Humitalea sp. 24SJ18S-53 TaxID=3422307 RepID=UPI003D67D9FE
MTPGERERVKTSLQAYLAEQQVSEHELARRISAVGPKVDHKVLHRFLDRRLQVDDSILEIYRGFLDRPV